MSKSLALINGDLAITGRSFSIVSGRDKLAQDLTLWVLEKVGTDPATPTYGNTLDGGVVNGVQIPSMVGQMLTQESMTTIQGIVQNLLQQYQQGQLVKMKAEIAQYGNSTLSNDEVIYSIDGIQVANLGDIVIIQANLTTLAKANLTVTIPLTI